MDLRSRGEKKLGKERVRPCDKEFHCKDRDNPNQVGDAGAYSNAILGRTSAIHSKMKMKFQPNRNESGTTNRKETHHE